MRKMGIFDKLFGKKGAEEKKAGGMEDYMTLIRVYFQAAIAETAGITNLAMLPDLRVFKNTLKVPTMKNKLGIAEKIQCKKMLKDFYKTDDDFFKEIDNSVKKNCKKMQDVQTAIRNYNKRLGFSQKWVTDFIYQIVMLAKKEKKPAEQ